jgi:tripartite-type tricarboxylate transporter receptor subunit TctC
MLPFSRQTFAQAYPLRPVRLVVPFPAGGQIDIIGRLIGQWLSQRTGQQFIVDNRPGAASNIGTEAVVRAAPDGYTLLVTSTTNTVNATLFDKLSFDFIRDTVAIAGINRIPLVLEVLPTFPATDVAGLIAYAKANPGKLSLGSPPKGTGPFMAAQLLKAMSGADIVHVPYRGDAQLVPDLLSGQVQAGFSGISAVIEQFRAGRLRALAVSTSVRLEGLSEIPTVGETLSGYEASGWCGLVAPKGTPAIVTEKLNKEINAALADPAFRARLADLIAPPMPGSPAEFAKLIADDTEKWSRVIRAANIKPD